MTITYTLTESQLKKILKTLNEAYSTIYWMTAGPSEQDEVEISFEEFLAKYLIEKNILSLKSRDIEKEPMTKAEYDDIVAKMDFRLQEDGKLRDLE